LIFKQAFKKYSTLLYICRIFLNVLLVLILILVTTQQYHTTAGNTYYVAKTGLDTNDGSAAHPWLTIRHAADTMMASDTVYVKSGTYNEWVVITTHSGTAGNPITFKAYPGDSPIIDGTGLSNPGYDYGLIHTNQSYINISGFEIRNNPYYEGVYIYNGSYINLTDLKIHGTAMSGIKLQGTTRYIVIDGCNLYDCNRNLGNETISIMPASNIEIKNCYIHDSPKAGIDGKEGSNNISIHDNEIGNLLEQAIYIDGNGFTQSGYSIYRNRIHDCPSGIALACEVTPMDQTNINIYNNLIYNNVVGFAVWPYSFPKTVSIINNTFYNNKVGIDWADTAAQYQVNCVVRNNIIVSNSTSALIRYDYYAQGGVSIDHNLFYDAAGYNTDTVYGTNYIKANPLLTNPTTDFSILVNSPAVNAGSSTGAPATDYEGTTRPSGTGVDIGAYEYVTTSTPPSVTTNSASK
jgi:hypothetical protein